LYVSQGAATAAVATGQFGSSVQVTGRFDLTGTTTTDTDAAYHYGQVNGEGLAPAFWRTNATTNGAVAWPRTVSQTGTLIYPTTATLGSIFVIPSSIPRGSTTLVQALGLTATTVADALLRSTTAALLNATHPRVAYPLTARQVIDQVNTALAGTPTHMKTLPAALDGYNSLGSDLDQNGNTNGPQHAALPAPARSSAPALTEEQLAPVLAEAVARWWAAGADITEADVRVVLTDLPDDDGGRPLLGYTQDGGVYLDPTARGVRRGAGPPPAPHAPFAARRRGRVPARRR